MNEDQQCFHFLCLDSLRSWTGFGLAALLLQVGIDLRLLGVGLNESQSIGLRKAHRLAGSSSS